MICSVDGFHNPQYIADIHAYAACDGRIQIPVTLDENEPFTWVGGTIPVDHLANQFSDLLNDVALAHSRGHDSASLRSGLGA